MTASRPASLELLDELRTPGSGLRRQLCVAVSTISSKIANEQQRALAQIWLPGFTPDGLIALTCAGAPYAIAGEGDLCALFRCVSCRYILYPTSPDADRRGSVGRAFLSHRPEICSNISTAPVELYHRAHEARQCLLHSLCVMPVWMPEVTRKAPVCVLEILQPETQPDFDSLHELTAQAFRKITRSKVTVIAPMPDINTWTEGDEYFVNPRTEHQGPPPGQASMMREAMQRHNAEQPEDASGPDCVHTSNLVGEERMQMVFNERARAENSDEHMVAVAERMAASNICAVPVSTGGIIQLENVEGFRMQADSAGPAGASPASHTGSGVAEECTERTQNAADVVMATAQATQAALQEHSGSNPGTDTPMESSPPQPDPGVLHRSRAREDGSAGPSHAHDHHQQQNQHHQQQQPISTSQPPTGQGSGEGTQQPQSVQCASAAGTAIGRPREAHSLRGLTGAVALLESVQQDQTWQAASNHGGSLKGSGVDLLAALHSQRPCSISAGRGNGPTLKDRPWSKKRSSVLIDVQEAKPLEDGSPPARPASELMRAGDAKSALPTQWAADAQPPSDPNRVTRNGFTYPSGERQSYMKVSVQRHTNQSIHSNPHIPSSVHSPFSPTPVADPAAAMRSHYQGRCNSASLLDKVQRVEGMHEHQHPAAAAASVPCNGINDPNAGMPRQERHHGGTQHTAALLAAAPSMEGVGAHRLVMPAVHSSLHAEQVAAGQFGPVQACAPHGAAMNAAGPGLVHPGDMAGAQVTYMTADAMHRSPSVHSIVVGPPGAGAAPVGMGMVATMPHVSSMGSLMNSAAGHTSDEMRALRNKVNRADGGIGRKLTMEVLQQYFGRGLKEAAEGLGMCPTTLKRACRRLGVKRWPRTPEMASQAIAEAQQTSQQQPASGMAGASVAEGWQSGGVDDGFADGAGADQGGLDAFETEGPQEGSGQPDHILAPNGQIGEFDDFWSNVLEASE